MAYTKLARLDELPEGALLEIVDGNNLYALCNVAGDIQIGRASCRERV